MRLAPLLAAVLITAPSLGCGEEERPTRPAREAPVEDPFGEADGEVGARRLAVGDGWTCALRDDRVVRCFGRLPFAAPDDDADDEDAPPPPTAVRELEALRGAVELSGSARRLCARDAAGRVACVQRGRAVRLPALDGATSVGAAGPVVCGGYDDGSARCVRDGRLEGGVARGLDDVIDVRAVGAHVCARRRAHPVTCWGGDAHSIWERPQEGPSAPAGIANVSGRPIAIDPQGALVRAPARRVGVPIVAFEAQGDRACAIDREGALRCLDAARRAYAVVPGEGRALELAIGATHACVRREAGRVSCWGANAQGQATGTPPPALDALSAVRGVEGAAQVAVAEELACARTEAGALACWTRVDEAARRVAGPALASITALRARVCGRTARGGVLCVRGPGLAPERVEGLDASGALIGERVTGDVALAVGAGGDVTLVRLRSRGPAERVALPALRGVSDLGFVARSRVCGRRGAALVCDGDVEVPTEEHPPEGMTRFFASARARFAVTEDGRVHAWGENTGGRLGVAIPLALFGGPAPPAPPWPVPELAPPAAMTATLDASCATFEGAPPRCAGHVGLARPRPPTTEPFGPLPGLDGSVRSLAIAPGAGCVAREDGSVACWGPLRADGHARRLDAPRPVEL